MPEGELTVVVCSCSTVSDRTIRAAIAAGASTVEELAERCAAASGCRGCRPELQRLLAQHARRGKISVGIA